MDSDTKIPGPGFQFSAKRQKQLNRLKVLGIVLTVLGIALFAYFVYSVGFSQIYDGVSKIGWTGFSAIIIIYFLRIYSRAAAWRLSVYEPYSLELKDTVQAVIIGEALSTMIPLGVLVSGTSKALAVRKKVPLVVGLSSIATENLFYSLATGLFISFGAVVFLRTFELAEGWIVTIDVMIGVIFVLIFLGILMVFRQWHFFSEFCERVYEFGFFHRFLEHGRLQVRLFENLIYAFYRRYPNRFLPILFFQVTFHVLGIVEVWFILSRISDVLPSLVNSFLLESVSRTITIFFKLVPFLIGVDEAGAQFVSETLALGIGVGVTLAIVRKGRLLFWTAVGLVLIIQRGLSLREIGKVHREEL